MRRLLLVAVALLVAGALAGCIGAEDGVDSSSEADAPSSPAPTDHPYPDGDETWPQNLTGPFELGGTLTDPITSHDGTPIETTIYVPELPDGVKAPVVLWSQPYTGACAANAGCMPASDSEFIYEGGYSRLNPSILVEHGYAVAIANVRGTSNSGGCFEFGGVNEQMDQVHLVEDLADREWSNGHVAMYGHSYHGFTPWMAAVEDPEPLKTVVASGLVTDPYTFTYSPQGAPATVLGPLNTAIATSMYIPPFGGGPQHATVEHADRFPGRLCPQAAQVLSETLKGQFTDLRDGAFWDERRLITDFPEISTAVLVSQGLNDDFGEAGHSFQDDDVWHSLPEATPKRMIQGQWGHDLPPPDEYIEDAPFGSDWYQDTALPWLDYWLKGVGDRDALHLGTVHYQDQTGDWHDTTAWPPAEADEEVLYLAPDGALSPDPSEGSRSFVSAGGVDAECGTPATESNSLLYATEPLDEPATLAGNPFAYLQLESTEPGGVVAVHLLDLGPEGQCTEAGGYQADGELAAGAADLRFHQGNYQGQNFPVLEPTPVRVDVFNDAWTFEEGHRVGVLVSPGEANLDARTGQPWTPRITVHGGDGPQASHVVLPLVDGTLGGDEPALDYPAQPFLPEGAGG